MFNFFKKNQTNILQDLGPLYHNYSFFGVNNEQLPGIYELNQKAKSPIISAYIALSLAKTKKSTSDTVSFCELFCADGFYTMVASRLGYDKCYGIDNDRDKHFANAKIIAKRLGITRIEFLKKDISTKASLPSTEVVANIGGLYHVENPHEILELSYRIAKKYLIVQSVVSLANDDENYFECPAPGWTWGNRMSKKSFDVMVRDICPNVIDHHFNKLEGNVRLDDLGSSYYLIKK